MEEIKLIEEKIFTTEQVANILQVHPFTILKFIKQGKLKGIKLGRVYRIKESDIKNFLEERMTSGGKKKEKETKKEEVVEEQKQEKKDKQEEIDLSYKIDKESEEDDHYYII